MSSAALRRAYGNFSDTSLGDAFARPQLNKLALERSPKAFVGPLGKANKALGVLEFIGHMLFPRWMNLRLYQRAFSTDPDALGVDVALGALVDFDHWLGCRPLLGARRSGASPPALVGDVRRLHATARRVQPVDRHQARRRGSSESPGRYPEPGLRGGQKSIPRWAFSLGNATHPVCTDKPRPDPRDLYASSRVSGTTVARGRSS